MFPVGTNHPYGSDGFILNFCLSCHNRCLGKCRGYQYQSIDCRTDYICIRLTTLFLPSIKRWVLVQLMTSSIIWHQKVEFILEARWRIPKLIYIVCRYLTFAIIAADLFRMSRICHLKCNLTCFQNFDNFLTRYITFLGYYVASSTPKYQSCTTYVTFNACEGMLH